MAIDLAELLPGANAGIPVSGISADSRTVAAGDLFVAVPGSRADGKKFAAEAARRGAVAIVGEGTRPADLPATTLISRSPTPARRWRRLRRGSTRGSRKLSSR